MWRPPCHSVQGPEAQVHGCATHYTRGADFCSNGKLVERERLENRVLQAIEEVVFAPETVEYLTAKVNEVLRHMTKPEDEVRRHQQAELDQARRNWRTSKRRSSGASTPRRRAPCSKRRNRRSSGSKPPSRPRLLRGFSPSPRPSRRLSEIFGELWTRTSHERENYSAS